ncbi:MAG: hypothetical protein A2286_07365 [Gammaproteobacteria bacterium RIFOXYA12_FULL_61_12]|nr:MAG: hypothetical protein A2514_12385 [Gammaproteobacteria bacterium RIFOXYD12_FULL_61_37]OGT92018.1 MAG: hypothetical protein A2286_07365 [Gammaproteobacteria bacterium RIFOXYA12_FULL_61_12]
MFVLVLIMMALEARASEPRDPTRPPFEQGPGPDSVVAAPQELPLQLNMTKVGFGRSIAIINGVTAKVGDLVNGARVAAIRSGEVVVVVRGRTQILTLQGASIKKPARHPGGAR